MLAKTNFPSLEQLRVLKCGIGSEGVKHLTKANW